MDVNQGDFMKLIITGATGFWVGIYPNIPPERFVNYGHRPFFRKWESTSSTRHRLP